MLAVHPIVVDFILFVLHQQWTCAFHSPKKSLNIPLLHVLVIILRLFFITLVAGHIQIRYVILTNVNAWHSIFRSRTSTPLNGFCKCGASSLWGVRESTFNPYSFSWWLRVNEQFAYLSFPSFQGLKWAHVVKAQLWRQMFPYAVSRNIVLVHFFQW